MLTHLVCLLAKQLQDVIFLFSGIDCLRLRLSAFLSFCSHLSSFVVIRPNFEVAPSRTSEVLRQRNGGRTKKLKGKLETIEHMSKLCYAVGSLSYGAIKPYGSWIKTAGLL